MFEINTSYNFEMLNGLLWGGIIFSIFLFIVFEAFKKWFDRTIPF